MPRCLASLEQREPRVPRDGHTWKHVETNVTSKCGFAWVLETGIRGFTLLFVLSFSRCGSEETEPRAGLLAVLAPAVLFCGLCSAATRPVCADLRLLPRAGPRLPPGPGVAPSSAWLCFTPPSPWPAFRSAFVPEAPGLRSP